MYSTDNILTLWVFSAVQYWHDKTSINQFWTLLVFTVTFLKLLLKKNLSTVSKILDRRYMDIIVSQA
jgi:hypothetical protein